MTRVPRAGRPAALLAVLALLAEGTHGGIGLSGVLASTLDDGRVVLNVAGDDGERLLLLDPATGDMTTLVPDLTDGLVAAAGDDLMVLLRPRADESDDRNTSWARLDRTAIPGEQFGP
jgi:hypothetical protein